MSEELRVSIEQGLVFWPYNVKDVELLEWHPHAKFAGVRLKHLVSSEQTGGRFSCHLVEIQPDKVLGLHQHEAQWELHEVVCGQGQCRLGDEQIRYGPGVTTVIPQGMEHSIEAGAGGLFLMAKFIPALV